MCVRSCLFITSVHNSLGVRLITMQNLSRNVSVVGKGLRESRTSGWSWRPKGGGYWRSYVALPIQNIGSCIELAILATIQINVTQHFAGTL